MDFFSDYKDYHAKMIDSLKMVLYKRDDSIFEKLDFYDDNVFTEPLLFACIHHEYDKWIDSLVFSLSKNKKELGAVSAPVIDNEIIYMPTIGYLKLSEKVPDTVKLEYRDETIVISRNDKVLSYETIPLITNEEGIEFLNCDHPLLKPNYADSNGNIPEVAINIDLYKKHISHFNDALNTIGKIYPEYFNLVKNYIKKVVFYTGELPNSFAAIKAHGMVFFNVRGDYNEIFFLDNILHQCAHVFFNALTFEKDLLFKIPHSSDLSDFTEDEEDKGHVLYGSYHGLFTQTNINTCMERCVLRKIYSGDEHYELLGRFTSNMKRFHAAVTRFDRPEKYKESGLKWFSFFKETYNSIYQRNKDIVESYYIHNQPYVFSYKVFKETNMLKF